MGCNGETICTIRHVKSIIREPKKSLTTELSEHALNFISIIDVSLSPFAFRKLTIASLKTLLRSLDMAMFLVGTVPS